MDPLWIQWPYARVRRELETNRGDIERFVFQLEYDIQATPSGEHSPEWRAVARFDHDIEGEQAHDIREEGLHLDVYRDGEKHTVVTNFPDVPLDYAPRFCQAFFEKNADDLLERFERWHDLYGPWRTHSSS